MGRLLSDKMTQGSESGEREEAGMSEKSEYSVKEELE